MRRGDETAQHKRLLAVLVALNRGDFSARMRDADGGVMSDIARELNALVARNQALSDELARVRRAVGRDGRLSERATLATRAGAWGSIVESVNGLIDDLAQPTTEVARVIEAVARGDLAPKMSVDAKGDIGRLKDTINTMVDTLRSFAAEVTRVAKEVGTEGRLGGQADVKGVSGTWKDLTDNVNGLADNLTAQVRNIAKVTTAVATGDLSQKITVEAKGEILELKNTINTMVDRLNAFAAEVTRVAHEVGTEGMLGGQARVSGVSGTWRDLTENVNQLASNLTSQVRNISLVTKAVASGDLSKKITVEAKGEIFELKDTINTMVDHLRTFASEVTRVAREVGTEGDLGARAEVLGVAGTWKDLTDQVNILAGNLTNQVRNIAAVTTAVANGDLSKKITVEARGEVLELKETVNRMVDQLNSFAAEVTRVAHEVGTEGRLGGQALVPGAAGTWKGLTDNVNIMATNLTNQVRGIARVVTAVACGDLAQKLMLDAKGEIAALADTINGMTDTLRVFADQVSTVAREVGIEGKLGGQARVPGAAGTWRDLTDNVNRLAGNLTTQVRAIAEVATAVTKGDLTRSISVQAQGEVLQLKDNINQMIANLRDTTRANKEQDWLKTNLAKFIDMMQGQRDIETLSRLIMSEVTPVVSAQHGAFFVLDDEGDARVLKLVGSYAYQRRRQVSNRFALGEGLVGQAALEKTTIMVTDAPEDYVRIGSGLGEAPPRNIVVLPVLFEGQVKAVIELASFHHFSPVHLTFLEQLTQSIGVVLNMIGAGMRTEELLQQLQRSNAQLEGRRKELEAKAKELDQSSRYKSAFLANMSHELRTPLNSLLILARMLADNEDGSLPAKVVEYGRTIYTSGSDLLALINEILDLSKIEAGRIELSRSAFTLAELRASVEQAFGPIARQKSLAFSVTVAPGAPAAIVSDLQKLQQILKNLLANALKFTEKGEVRLEIAVARQGPEPALGFTVADTGIGIAEDKQQLIFEAFQQADTSTARRYGGTGLGLAISRELARLLGGEIRLESAPRRGSAFTLILPYGAAPPSEERPRPAEEAAALPPAGRRLDGRRILIIDDDPRNLFAAASLLESQGAEVIAAESAGEGIELLDARPGVELVLMDIMMPDLDGYQATQRIRGLPCFASLPIVALTAKAMQEDAARAIEAGCCDFVSKPVRKEELLAVIARWVPPSGA